MIDPREVEEMFTASIVDTGTLIDGIMTRVALNVDGREDRIGEILAELPDEFQAAKGGGWSVLNACMTRDGEQWTGLHSTVEKLFLLGIAANKARWLFPREMWSAMPGGMPYVSVN